MTSLQSPRLSIIATARNDNHGGDLLRRMQIFINGILAQSERYQLPLEVVLVEWNPPTDLPKLAQVLSWPVGHVYCTIRIIEVPTELHARYRHAASLPLYQMIAKNVGIRRARGEYILVTNIDILFPNELFAYFTSEKLTKNKVYRVDRYDVNTNVPLDATIEEQLDYCKNNVIRINCKSGTFKGNSEIVKVNDPKYIPLHTNGCGDFQLIHRAHWYQLRGYPEFDLFSLHLDSLFEYIACYSGLEEVELPYPARINHIEHAIGSGWTPEGDKVLANRLKSANIPSLAFHEVLAVECKMEMDNRSFIFNDENWGLARENLSETIVLRSTATESVPFEMGIETQTRDDLRIDHRYAGLSKDFDGFRELIKNESEALCKQVLSDTIINLKILINLLDGGQKKIIVFGTGEGFRQFVLPVLNSLQLSPDYLIDNDPAKFGSEYAGIKIYPVQRVLEEDQDGILIIIASFMYYPVMITQLESMGFKQDRNVYWMMHRYILAVRSCWHLITKELILELLG